MANFSYIRDSVESLLNEEREVPPDSPFFLSELWRDANNYLDYIRDLSDDHLRQIRLHTSLITGVPWFNYAHNPVRFLSEEEISETPLISSYRALVSEIPEQYWSSEPIADNAIKNVGLEWKDKIISDDIVRFQRTITNLYNLGIFRDLEEIEKPIIFEIGSGYGGLAHAIYNILGKGCYIVLDQPSMLFWSGVYISLHNPGARLSFVTGKQAQQADWEKLTDENDFLFVPNYALDDLSDIGGIDFAINLLSFQEMKDQQIIAYAEFLQRKLRGILFSENFARHPINKELTKDISDILEQYLLLTPNPAIYKQQPWYSALWRLFIYICITKEGKQLSPIRPSLIGEGYTININ